MQPIGLENIYKYAEQHSTPENDLLYELNRKTNLEVAIPQMISGHLQGAFLKFMSQMLQPKMVLEIGTYTSYSAICMAYGLAEGGKIITLDNNKYLVDIQEEYIARAGFKDQIELKLGDAADIIPNIKQDIDLVFIDADKINYGMYFDLVIDKVRQGGIIIADNVLYDGEVLRPKEASKNGKAINLFNKKIQADPRVENMLLPLRDGLMLMVKL
jgi:caffeoyl-CoA O-methyltransferase